MKLHVTSIAPIELFTIKRRQSIENTLLRKDSIVLESSTLEAIFKEIAGQDACIYSTKDHRAKLAFHGSSLCVCYEKQYDDWQCSIQTIAEELAERNEFHENLIRNNKQSPIREIVREIIGSISHGSFPLPSINYIFSFYVLEDDSGDDAIDEMLYFLAEPSLIDMDDMLSTSLKREIGEIEEMIEGHVKESALSELRDVDIANNATTYITWATIVSRTTSFWLGRTKDLLCALELRLQLTWNRCFSISQYIEAVFDETEKMKASDLSELYWGFVRTLDDAKAVLSSTYSSRADRLFSEMIDTSRVEGEIDRLEQKINLLEKFVDQKREQTSKKYQKTIEILLFVTAIASLAGLFFPLPMTFISDEIGYLILLIASSVGLIAILRSS